MGCMAEALIEQDSIRSNVAQSLLLWIGLSIYNYFLDACAQWLVMQKFS